MPISIGVDMEQKKEEALGGWGGGERWNRDMEQRIRQRWDRGCAEPPLPSHTDCQSQLETWCEKVGDEETEKKREKVESMRDQKEREREKG